MWYLLGLALAVVASPQGVGAQTESSLGERAPESIPEERASPEGRSSTWLPTAVVQVT